MSEEIPLDSTPPSNSNESKTKTWERADAGIWLHVPSGTYYERPTINGKPTYRSLGTKNLAEAKKEYCKRHGKGDAAYTETVEEPESVKK